MYFVKAVSTVTVYLELLRNQTSHDVRALTIAVISYLDTREATHIHFVNSSLKYMFLSRYFCVFLYFLFSYTFPSYCYVLIFKQYKSKTYAFTIISKFTIDTWNIIYNMTQYNTNSIIYNTLNK